MRLVLAFLIAFLVLGCACEKSPTDIAGGVQGLSKGFYYWKNNSDYMDWQEQQWLDTLGTRKLYVKFFEVAPNALFGGVPEAKTIMGVSEHSDSSMRMIEIVPTIFVRNDALKRLSNHGIDSLADNIFFLANKMFADQFNGCMLPWQELQLDCDWTASTKDAYFRLVSEVKKRSGKVISCTLRLYPYKYPDKMGVPPADRAMLMCYNLISPVGNPKKNSVLDLKELESYMHDAGYPLPLDLALPTFSLTQVYRGGQFMGLVRLTKEQRAQALKQTPNDPLWHTVVADTEIGDAYLRAGDQVKLEEISPEILLEACKLLRKRVKLANNATIALFHLDQANLNRYSHETLTRAYTIFGQ